MGQKFAETDCAVEIPALAGLSITTLSWLHRSVSSAGDVFEGLGFTTTDKGAKNVLLGLSDTFILLQNAIVDEMATRSPVDDVERRRRALVLRDDAGRCLDPDEYATELVDLVGRL